MSSEGTAQKMLQIAQQVPVHNSDPADPNNLHASTGFINSDSQSKTTPPAQHLWFDTIINVHNSDDNKNTVMIEPDESSPLIGPIVSRAIPGIVYSYNSYFKTAMCDYVQEDGACRWGDSCKYAHSVSELQPRPPRPICTHFRLGKCAFGDECYKEHSLVDTGGPLQLPSTEHTEERAHRAQPKLEQMEAYLAAFEQRQARAAEAAAAAAREEELRKQLEGMRELIQAAAAEEKAALAKAREADQALAQQELKLQQVLNKQRQQAKLVQAAAAAERQSDHYQAQVPAPAQALAEARLPAYLLSAPTAAATAQVKESNKITPLPGVDSGSLAAAALSPRPPPQQPLVALSYALVAGADGHVAAPAAADRMPATPPAAGKAEAEWCTVAGRRAKGRRASYYGDATAGSAVTITEEDIERSRTMAGGAAGSDGSDSSAGSGAERKRWRRTELCFSVRDGGPCPHGSGLCRYSHTAPAALAACAVNKKALMQAALQPRRKKVAREAPPRTVKDINRLAAQSGWQPRAGKKKTDSHGHPVHERLIAAANGRVLYQQIPLFCSPSDLAHTVPEKAKDLRAKDAERDTFLETNSCCSA